MTYSVTDGPHVRATVETYPEALTAAVIAAERYLDRGWLVDWIHDDCITITKPSTLRDKTLVRQIVVREDQ